MAQLDRDYITSRVLRIGVNTSIAIIVIGIVLMFVKGSADNYSLSQLASYTSYSATLNSSMVPLSRIPAGLISLDAVYYIALGLWVLLFTPITVVVIATVFFARERNYLYVAMSVIVLINIFVAMLIVPGLIGK